jgi:hypothetical protein
MKTNEAYTDDNFCSENISTEKHNPEILSCPSNELV